MTRAALSAGVLCLAIGCSPSIPEGVLACDEDAQCPRGWVCGSDSRCYASRGDSPASEAPDAGNADASGTPQADAGIDASGAATDGATANADASEADGGADGAASVEQAIARLMRYLCDAVSRCEPKTGALVTAALAVPACHPALGFAQTLEALEQPLQDGDVRFDSARVQQCLDALSTLPSCQRPAQLPQSCAAAVIGSASEDAPCSVDDQCASGMTCVGEGHCPGRCRPLGSTGAPCEAHDDCAASHACGSDATCLPRRQLNESCSDSAQCAASQYCDDVCRELPGAGERCAVVLGASLCAGDLVCVGAGAGLPGLCEVGAGAGEPCGSGAPCRVGLRCFEGQLRCRAIAPAFGDCAGADCPYGMFCDDGRCQPRPVVGESCTPGCSGDCARCIEGACDNGTCALLPDGAACTPGVFRSCQGYCERQDSGARCTAKKSAGSACESDRECDADNGEVCLEGQAVCGAASCG